MKDSHMDGVDAAVAKVLFGKEHGLAVDIGDQLVCAERLAEGERGQIGIVLASCLLHVPHQVRIEAGAALLERSMFCLGCFEHGFFGHAVARRQ